MEQHVERLITRVSPAVVAVQVGQGAGSGVIVTADGMVLCAAHVCGEPGRPVRFTFPDGRVVHGKTLGLNHEMDSGLMKITDKGTWPHVELGDRMGLKPGEWVLALGHPGGFDAERSVVARLGRVIRAGGMLQTDCTLIGGDSGGPLFDMRGRVIGIHSRISESTSENFHVAIRNYEDSWDRLAKGDEWGIERLSVQATIGVRGENGPEGCRLYQVIENGPAYKAGLMAGDLILRVQGETINDAEGLAQTVHKATPGEELIVRIKRAGSELSIKVMAEPVRWGRGWGPG